MKLKKFATIFVLSILSFFGVFFGCTGKYDNFSIEVNGESSITLSTSNSGDLTNEANVQIYIKNAPNDACRVINYSVSKTNIVSITKLSSNSKDIAIFKIKALDNISSYDPSCVITFTSAEGNKSCELQVKVVIPVTGISKNEAYTPYVVAGDEIKEGVAKNYYINSASLISFAPINTTQRDVIYSLADESLKEKYGINLTENGAISILKTISEDNVAIPSTIKLVATSKSDNTKSFEFDVRVLRDIKNSDFTISYNYENSSNISTFTNDEINEENHTYTIKECIVLASNRSNYRNVELTLSLNENSGLDFNVLNLEVEKLSLNNAIIEEFNSTDSEKQFKIYSINPNADYITLILSYKDVSEYSKVISIPLEVREYPISLVVNDNISNTYNIYDFYSNNEWGQNFNIKLNKASAYNTSFKVIISEENFNLLDIRYKNQILDYQTLSGYSFDNDSNLTIRAKNLNTETNEKTVEIQFLSSILFDESGNLIVKSLELEENANLYKTINLNLLPGAKSLQYKGLFSDNRNEFFLQSGESIDVEYLVNNDETFEDLNNVLKLEISKGADLVVVSKDSKKFTIKSLGYAGEVEFKIYSENGLESSTKKIKIYNYDENYNNNLTLNLDSNNIQTVLVDGVEKYYIGMADGKNSANFKINNPENASIYNATIESNFNGVLASVISVQNLTFNLYALSSTNTNTAKITVTIYLYDSNDVVNLDSPKTIEISRSFEITTYNPITNVTLLQNDIEIVDGIGLDLDSKNNNYNVLDVSKIIRIEKAGNDLSSLEIDYIFPSSFKELIKTNNETRYEQILNNKEYTYVEDEDYLLYSDDESPFKNIVFFVGKNHVFDSTYTFSFTIRIKDIVGSNNYHLIPVRVILQKQVGVDDIQILNNMGFVYLENTAMFGQISAKAISNSGKEVTNDNLEFKIKNGNAISVGEDSGLINILGSGISEVTIYAKSSKYNSTENYSVSKTIYVVVADGSKSYPYILNGQKTIENNRYYTLNEDIVLNEQISETISNGGINGQFVYSSYSNLNNLNSSYKLIYNGEGSIFKEDEISYNLQNLEIIYNENKVSLNEDFGLIAKINNGTLDNVTFSFASLEISSSETNLNVGLLFSENKGNIINTKVKGEVLLNANEINFGGLVAKNSGTISGKYNFLNSNVEEFNANLRLLDSLKANIIGGLVAENYGNLNNVKVEAIILSNALNIGGVVGKIATTNKSYSNIYFTGSINGGNNSVVGGISAEVENANNFSLLTVNLISNPNNLTNIFTGKTLGGLFGKTNNIEIKYAYITSFVNNANDLSGQTVGGLIGQSYGDTKLTTVHSEVKISGSTSGAFIGTSENVMVLDAYTKSTGITSYVGDLNGNTLTLSETYSTTFSVDENENHNYGANNYLQTSNDSNFNDANYFVSSNGTNNNLPYLVYKENDGYKKLLTIEATSITANFISSTIRFGNNYYGIDKNMVVISDNTNIFNKAVIFYKNNLEYNLSDIINIVTLPYDASLDMIDIISSNNSVVLINNGKLIINGLGGAIVTIQSKTNKDVKAEVYINIVEKISSFNLNNNESKFSVSKSNSKLFGYTLASKNNNNGISFNFSENVPSYLLFNSNIISNNIIYSTESLSVFTALNENFVEFNSSVIVAPFYKLNFGGELFNLVDADFSKQISFYALEGATSISVQETSVEVTYNSLAEFNVYVGGISSEDVINNLVAEFLDTTFNNYISINVEPISYSNQVQSYKITLSMNSGIDNDAVAKLRIYHNSNPELYTMVDVVIKSTRLVSVELNHYGSSVEYYDDYNSIINKNTLPSTEIVAGNLGVLNINLYPSQAKITDVEIYSSVVNGNYILFSQLAYKDNSLIVVNNNGNVRYGLKLAVEKSVVTESGFNYNGNLYVSTLLSGNVSEDTVFVITVVCYSLGLSEPITETIELKAKALTSIILSNPNGDKNFYLAKGADLTLDIKMVNLDLTEALGETNFIFEVSDSQEDYIKYNVNGNKLIITSNILTKRGTTIKVTPTFSTYINNQYVGGIKSESITITVVDFVVNGLIIENSEDDILNNNLGSATYLTAKLDVSVARGYEFDNNRNIRSYNETELLEYSNIQLKIKALENVISKNNFSWNLITTSSNGTIIYNNLIENGNYNNFSVGIDSNGFYYIVGKTISVNRLLLKANIGYNNGLVVFNDTNSKEYSKEFALNIKTYSSLDNPIPVTNAEEFLTMEEGGNYILYNDITLDSTFSGIDTKIASFDGNNKIINIQGLSVVSASQTNLGLFNEVNENTIIKNVTLNILPTIYYLNNSLEYGINVNAQELTSLNFGLIAGINNGVITNCKVVNNNVLITNNNNIYNNITINITNNENVDLKVGAICGVNNGFITNSSVGNEFITSGNTYINTITINAIGKIGGFVSENNNKIAASSVKNITIYNNAKSKLTAGFVAENFENSSIITSYVEGVREDEREKVQDWLKQGGIYANSYVGGFVAVNSGNIKDSYSNILISTNKRSAGFVYDNTNGYIETCYSASSSSDSSSQSFRGFVGNNEENVTLDSFGIKYCYFLGTINEQAREDEFGEHATQIIELKDPQYLEGFISDNSSSTIWVFNETKGYLPMLYDAEHSIVSERRLLDESTLNKNVDKYEYIYINNNIGSINNPIIVSNTEELLNAFTDPNFLYSYYYNGKIYNTNINYSYINLVKDIDLSKIIDANNNVINSESEVQKLQDIIFAGNLNGNGMDINNITIAAKNNTNYTSFGLFKQIGVDNIYDNSLNIVNSKLDEDNCSAIKNLNLNINNISATITKSVGALSGEVINSKLYNINVNGEADVVVTGANMVGGIAGRISGNSFVKGVSSSLSVKATYDNKSLNYDYNISLTKKMYRFANDNFEDNTLNSRINIAGGLFGVVDLYTINLTNYSQNADANSYYINAEINRNNNLDLSKAHIQFVKVNDNFTISGDIVGGLFGYVESGSKIYDARLELNDSASQNLIANYTAGGIVGKNKGYLSYAVVEHEITTQRQLDSKAQEEYITPHLFSNENNNNNNALVVGGIVGVLENGILDYSYSKANIVSKNTLYVGSAVGLFINSTINSVYAVSYMEAQDREYNSENVLIKNAGYAGLIGRISNFSSNSASSISEVVSIVRNTNFNEDYFVAGLVGYNSVETTRITSAEFNNNVISNYGRALDNNVSKSFEYNDFKDSASTWSSFRDSSHWIRQTENGDIYYRLTYNKRTSFRQINSEEDLINALRLGSDVELTGDIYLSKPWSPISNYQGELNGNGYTIYNLNINEKSENIAGHIGFFASTENDAQIHDITFVVGTTYTAPQYEPENPRDKYYRNKTNYENDNEIESDHYGIYITPSLSGATESALGVVVGKATNTAFNNVNIEFGVKGIEKDDELPINAAYSQITTNLTYVGGLVGYAERVTVNNRSSYDAQTTITNIKIERKNNSSFENSFVGGLIGKVTNAGIIKNVTIDNSDVYDNDGYIGAIQNKGNNYVGGLVGVYSSSSSDSKILNINLRYIHLKNTGGNNIFVGTLGGEISCNAVDEVSTNIFNVEVNKVENSSKGLEVYVGGLIGHAQISKISNINQTSNTQNNINVSTGDYTIIDLCVGGLVGFNDYNGSEISNVIASSIVKVDTKNTSMTNVGGLVGKNGGKRQNAPIYFGATISNVITKTYLRLSNSQITESIQQNVGGVVGYNYKASLQNVIFLGNIKSNISSLNYVGGAVGANIDNSGNTNQSSAFNSEDDKVFFIEDLNLTPSRDIEFGVALSYSEFIEDKTAYLPQIYNYSEILFDEDYNNLGTVYNPEELTTENIKNTTEFTYYILNSDLSLTTTIDSLNGIIIGNGHTITVNKSFTNEITQNAVISSLMFKLEDDSNYETFNGEKYVKDVNAIVTITNNGAIYNIAVKGNININGTGTKKDQLANTAAVAVMNNGFINVVTSNVHIIVISKASSNEANIGGFVAVNDGLIANSTAIGAIEVCYEYYSINSQNTYLQNLGGFVSGNNSLIINSISGVTLPIKQGQTEKDKINYSFGEESKGISALNSYADYFANGNFDGTYSKNYKTTNEIIGNIKSNNVLNKNITNNLGVIYGYPYVTLKLNNVDYESFLSTKVTENSKDFYLFNNYGSMRYIIEKLQENNREIFIKQIASFNAKIENISKNNSGNYVANIAENIFAIKLNNNLTYNGNNFVINNLTIEDIIVTENRKTKIKESTNGIYGLFYCEKFEIVNPDNVTTEEVNPTITISSLALKDINLITMNEYENIFVGAFVAKSDGIVNIQNCYVDGLILDKNNDLNNKNTTYTNLYIGSLVGRVANESVISSNVSDVTINIANTQITTGAEETNNSLIQNPSIEDVTKVFGYTAYIGGIVANATNAKVSNNISLGSIKVSSVKELYMGGIIGALNVNKEQDENATSKLQNNLTISKVVYSGAYLGYYADNTETNLLYNINAVAGKLDSGVTILDENNNVNIYNSQISLAKDETLVTINGETKDYHETDATIISESSFEISSNNFTNGEETKLITTTNFVVVNDNNLTIESNNLTIESNKFYIVTASGEITLIAGSTEIENTTLIFLNDCYTAVSSNIFNELENCTIVNLKIFGSLETASLANRVKNSIIKDITLQDVYAYRNNSIYNSIYNSLVIDCAENSVLDNINVNYGRLEVVLNSTTENNTTFSSGAIVGYAQNSAIKNCSNSATITVSVQSGGSLTANTGSIAGYTQNSNIFKCTNNGLVYAKTLNSSVVASMNTSGIAPADNASYVTFCKNENKVKAVTESNNSTANYLTGITTSASVWYSVNNGSLLQVTKKTSNSFYIATGLGLQNVIYSYNKGSVASNSNAYSLTLNNAYYSYNLGGGYKPNSSGTLLLIGVEGSIGYKESDYYVINLANKDNPNEYDFNDKAYPEEDFERWFITFANKSDEFGLKEDSYGTATNSDGKTSYTTKKEGNLPTLTSLVLPVVRLIDETDFNPLTIVDNTYQISNGFELWYWARFGDLTNYDVVLTDDIDMLGYTYQTAGTFTKEFDGNGFTINGMNITYRKSSDHSNTYFGLVSINKGTIKNIYFEDPSISIEKNELIVNNKNNFSAASNNYFGIVAAINNGTIENILVGAINENIFIDFTYQVQTLNDATFYFGIISGYNSGEIDTCEIINLRTHSIFYKIIVNEDATWSSNDVNIYVGGISGKCESDAGISNSIFLGSINGVLKNYNRYASTGSKILDFLIGDIYSEAKTYFGYITTGDGGNINNNFALMNNDENEVYFLNIETMNLYGDYKTGKPSEEKLWENLGSTATRMIADATIGLFLKSTAGKVAFKFIAKAIGKGLSKVVLKAIPVVGWIYFGADAIKSFVFGVHNSESLVHTMNNTGVENIYNNDKYKSINQNLLNINIFEGVAMTTDEGVAMTTEDNSDFAYIETFIEGIETLSVDSIYEKFATTLGYNKLVINKEFFKLSKRTDATKLMEINDKKYLIYNVNQFAKALTKLDSGNIILMDNINMTKAVWDFENGKIKTDLDIITNNFKIVYGGNKNFKDEFVEKYSSLINALVASKIYANEYGYFDNFTKNNTVQAYLDFQNKFMNAGGTLSGDASNNGIYSVYEINPNNGSLKYQLEVIADAMMYYTCSDETIHPSINFTGKTIKLTDDVDLTKEGNIPDILSLDIYSYSENENGQIMRPMFEYDQKISQLEKEKQQTSDENRIKELNNEIEKIKRSKGEDVFINLLFEKRGIFNGTFNGNNKTITTDNILFLSTAKNAQIINLTINYKSSNIYGGAICSSINLGTIENVTIKTLNNLKYYKSYDYINMDLNVESDGDNKYFFRGLSTENYGIFTSSNFGKITNCKFIGNSLSISSNINISYKDTQIKLTGPDPNNSENIIEYDYNLVSEDATKAVTTIINSFGIFAGINYGEISDINLTEINVSYENLIVNKIDVPEGKSESITVDISKAIGLISGQNIYDYDYPNNGINNVTLIGCDLKVNSIETGNIGLISSTNSMNTTNVKVLNSSAYYLENNINKYVSNENITIGGIYGLLKPELISKLIDINKNNKTITETVYSTFTPTISECCFINPNTDQKPIGELGTLAIEKVVEITGKDESGNEITQYMSRVFLNGSFFTTIEYYYNILPDSLSGDMPYGANNCSSILQILNSTNNDYAENLQSYLTSDYKNGNIYKTISITNPFNTVDVVAKVENTYADPSWEGYVSYPDNIQLKVKLTVEGTVIELYDGNKFYKTTDFNFSEDDTIAYISVSRKGTKEPHASYTPSGTIIINGKKFIVNVKYSESQTQEGQFGFTVTANFTKLSIGNIVFDSSVEEGETAKTFEDIGELKTLLDNGFAFTDGTDVTGPATAGTYTLSYTFTKNGETVTINNITLTLTDTSTQSGDTEDGE